MAASDQNGLASELAVEQAIRQLGQSVSDNVSPPILVMTPKKCRPRTYPPLAVAGISSGLFFISTHQRLRNNLAMLCHQ